MLSFIEFGRRSNGEFYWGPSVKDVAGDAALADDVEGLISTKDIVVFSSPTCPFCRQAIQALEDAGFAPTVVDASPAQRAALAAKCGSSSVPKVFVRGQFIGGCNDGGMGGVLPLLRSGKIKELLSSSE